GCARRPASCPRCRGRPRFRSTARRARARARCRTRNRDSCAVARRASARCRRSTAARAPRSPRRTSPARRASRRNPSPRTRSRCESFYSLGNASSFRCKVVDSEQAAAPQEAAGERLPEIGAVEKIAHRALETLPIVIRLSVAKVAVDERTRELSNARPKREKEQVRRILRADIEQERRNIAIRIGPVVFHEARVDGGREVDEHRAFRAPLHENVIEVEVAVDAVRAAVELIERGADRPEHPLQLARGNALKSAAANDLADLDPAGEVLVVDAKLTAVG